MSTIWLVSDTHFGHQNIITYCNRPFTTAEEMDEAIIQRWNAVVRPQDHVYHLGDVAMKATSLALVQRLNGHKRLVRGNHDIFKTKQYLAAGFEEIHGVRVIDKMALTHVPVHPSSLGRWHGNVHGHTHGMTTHEAGYLDVSVECINYTPITLEQARARLDEQWHRKEVLLS